MTRMSNRNPGNDHSTGQQVLCLCDKSGYSSFCNLACRTEYPIGGSTVICPLNLSRPRRLGLFLYPLTGDTRFGRLLKQKSSQQNASLLGGHGQGHDYPAELWAHY